MGSKQETTVQESSVQESSVQETKIQEMMAKKTAAEGTATEETTAEELTVSVIIPAYNRAATIGRAIQSILKQTHPVHEIIIVDDASTDTTVDVVKALHDTMKTKSNALSFSSSLSLIQHATNNGAAAARNTGIKVAKGQYIAFLDSDDEWAPHKLERQLEFLKKSSEEIQMVCTGFTLNILDDKKVIENRLLHHRDINQSIYEGCDLSPGSTLLANRDIFDQVGLFDEKLSRLEDWDWLLRYRQVGRIGVIHELLATIYNQRGRQGDALKRSVPLFIKNHMSTFNQLGFLKKRAIIANMWLQVGGTLLREKKIVSTAAALFIAFFWDPFVIFKYYLRSCETADRTRLKQ